MALFPFKSDPMSSFLKAYLKVNNPKCEPFWPWNTVLEGLGSLENWISQKEELKSVDHNYKFLAKNWQQISFRIQNLLNISMAQPYWLAISFIEHQKLFLKLFPNFCWDFVIFAFLFLRPPKTKKAHIFDSLP